MSRRVPNTRTNVILGTMNTTNAAERYFPIGTATGGTAAEVYYSKRLCKYDTWIVDVAVRQDSDPGETTIKVYVEGVEQASATETPSGADVMHTYSIGSPILVSAGEYFSVTQNPTNAPTDHCLLAIKVLEAVP